jgi:hypothetical protein
MKPFIILLIFVGLSVSSFSQNLPGKEAANELQISGGVVLRLQGATFTKTKVGSKIYYDITPSGGTANAITSINSLTDPIQTFATSQTGSGLTISSVGAQHTFNLPNASQTQSGLVNTSAQTFVGLKSFNNLAIPTLANGRIPYVGASGILGTSSNLCFDYITQRVGIGTSFPTTRLEVNSGTTGNSGFKLSNLNGNATNSSYLATDASGNVRIGTAFTTGTAGADFNIGSNSVFNLPDAGLSARGVVTTGDQNFIGIKTFSAVSNTLPTTTGNVLEGNFRVKNNFGASGNIGVLDVGFDTGGSSRCWLQSRNAQNYAINNALMINPNGGNVGVGTTNAQNTLHIDSKTAGQSGVRLQQLPSTAYLATNANGDIVAAATPSGSGSYTAGTGISLAGNVVTNTAPNQVVSLTGTGATNVTGTYPNFTINSTAGGGSNATFTTGTAGSDLNVVSTANAHVINLPDASQTARGVVSTGAQTFVGTKSFNNLALPTLAPNRIPFVGPSNLVSVSSNLAWDYTNNRLGVGTSFPSTRVEIASGAPNDSGLKFTNLNSASPQVAATLLGVDATGKVVATGVGVGKVRDFYDIPQQTFTGISGNQSSSGSIETISFPHSGYYQINLSQVIGKTGFNALFPTYFSIGDAFQLRIDAASHPFNQTQYVAFHEVITDNTSFAVLTLNIVIYVPSDQLGVQVTLDNRTGSDITCSSLVNNQTLGISYGLPGSGVGANFCIVTEL